MPVAAVAGCGYVGERVAGRLAARGLRVLAGRRHPDRWDGIRPAGVIPVGLDLDSGRGLEAMATAQVLVCAYPPPSEGSGDPRTARLLAALAGSPPGRVVYLSTTGLYGDRRGAVVDETAAPAPRSARARRRQDAERRIRRFGRDSGWVVNILRVAGIYGPGRLPAERIRKGEALRVAWPEPRFTNTIHVSDLVSLVLRVLVRGRLGRLYNACDGAEREQGALLEATARALGLELPAPVPPAQARLRLSADRLAFLAESRRCRNDRAQRELGWEPAFTDLDTGVRASLAEGQD